MSSRFVLIICSNGRGHLQRSKYILAELLQFIDASRVTVISDLINEAEAGGAKIIPLANLPALDRAGLNKWEKLIQNLELAPDDVLISDNLVEPALYFDNSHIFANFFWHEEETHFQIGKSLQSEIRSSLPTSTNVYFSSLFEKPYHSLYNSRSVGLFGGRLTPGTMSEDRIKRVAFAGGKGGHLARDRFKELTRTVVDFLGPGEYFGDDYLVQPGVAPFSFALADIGSMDAIVTRAGIGMISDCLRFGMKPVFFPADDTEMELNIKSMVDKGLALTIDQFLASHLAPADLRITYNDFKAEKDFVALVFATRL